MTQGNTKRFLITFDSEVDGAAETSSFLGTSKSEVKDGVAFLATDGALSQVDILHFDNLNITSAEMTSAQAEKLAQKSGVLAVEEDVEMHAIGQVEEVMPPQASNGKHAFQPTDEEQYHDLFLNSEETEEYDFELAEDGYSEGYEQAMMDVFSALLKANRLQRGKSQESTALPKLPIRLPPFNKQPVPWNISLVKAPAAWARGITGLGVKVAVLDTGIATHPDLVISGGVSFVPGVASYNDGHGHGTHCAGIIGARNNIVGVVGVAPRCSLYAVKVLSDAGSGSSSWIIAGLEWCVKNGIQVASMSLGGTSDPMVAYANAILRCQNNGVTVSVASGNSYGTAFPWVCSPANSVLVGKPNASPLAVGSIEKTKVISSFSSRGARISPWNQVSVVAPGGGIYSTYKGGGYATMSGTSMACPHVSGLAALVRQRYAGILPASIKTRIGATSTDLGSVGRDITYGFGLINCDRATL